MPFSANHYIATYDDGNNANTTKIEVYAEDDTKAAAKVFKAIPTAQNIVVSSAPS